MHNPWLFVDADARDVVHADAQAAVSLDARTAGA